MELAISASGLGREQRRAQRRMSRGSLRAVLDVTGANYARRDVVLGVSALRRTAQDGHEEPNVTPTGPERRE